GSLCDRAGSAASPPSCPRSSSFPPRLLRQATGYCIVNMLTTPGDRGKRGTHMGQQPDPAALQAVIDKMEIGELQSRYMFALDWHEPDVYSSMFTEDATLEWPEGSATGREAIHTACVRIGKFFDNLAAAAGPRKPFRLRHFVTNRVFDIKGDRARVWAYWLDLNNDNLQRWPY